jgi:hypothetical protein
MAAQSVKIFGSTVRFVLMRVHDGPGSCVDVVRNQRAMSIGLGFSGSLGSFRSRKKKCGTLKNINNKWHYSPNRYRVHCWLSISGRFKPMNNVPEQNVIPRLISPFPTLVLIVTCLVGDQHPFASRTNASQGNDGCGCDT